jgi:hypothetical protein
MAIDNHLEEIDKTYLEHLVGAWKVAFILFVHGLLPNIWRYKASDLLYKETKRSGIRIVN